MSGVFVVAFLFYMGIMNGEISLQMKGRQC